MDPSSREFFELQRQYLQMTPLRFFVYPASATSLDAQERLVELLKSAHVLARPPSRAYSRAFLKAYLARCEKGGGEVAEELYEVVAAAVGEAEAEEKVCYKTYLFKRGGDGNLDSEEKRSRAQRRSVPIFPQDSRIAVPEGFTPVVLQETPQMISQGTTGLCTWPAAMYLVEWMGKHAALFAGKRVLELGAGVGLVGLALARITQAGSIVLSDCSGQVLNALEANLQLNHLTARWPSDKEDGKESDGDVELLQLDWRDATAENIEAIGADLVVAADVVYDGDIIPHLVRVISVCLRAPGPARGARECIIASTQRNESTLASFVEAWGDQSAYHVDVEAFVPTPGSLVYDATCPIFLHRIRLQAL